MANFNDMSDEEINALVMKAKGYGVSREDVDAPLICYHEIYGSCDLPDFCNDADEWAILLEENKISVNYISALDLWVASDIRKLNVLGHERIGRAVAMVFILGYRGLIHA